MKEYKLKINGNDYNVVINDVQESVASIEVNGSNYKVEFEKPIVKPTAIKVVKTATAAPAVSAAAPKPAAVVKTATAAPAVSAAAPKPAAAPAPTAGGTTVSSPLPGVILEVCVKEGDTVKNGQKIMVLEAMKMENVVEATADGVIKSIKVNKGDSVMEGTPLAIIG